MGYWGVVMQDLANELRRIHIPRTPVNRGRLSGGMFSFAALAHRSPLDSPVTSTLMSPPSELP
jgi:hypothetical protein